MGHNKGVQRTGNARIASVINRDVFRILGVCFGMLVRLSRRRRNLFLENLALRQQLVAHSLPQLSWLPCHRFPVDPSDTRINIGVLRPENALTLNMGLGA
jgi:hypothetical protein